MLVVVDFSGVVVDVGFQIFKFFCIVVELYVIGIKVNILVYQVYFFKMIVIVMLKKCSFGY